MIDIAIYGAGGFGREVLTLLEQVNSQERRYNFIGFFDDGKVCGSDVNGYLVLGGINELNAHEGRLALILALGDPMVKKTIYAKIKKNDVIYPSLVHPSVIVGDWNYGTLGKGCVICAGCLITVNITIHDFTILNLGCTVGHDTEIGAFSSFMPSVNISGEVKIEEGVYVGTGVKIINRLNIGNWTIVGAGAVVSRNLPACCTAVGIPAKPIKYHKMDQ